MEYALGVEESAAVDDSGPQQDEAPYAYSSFSHESFGSSSGIAALRRYMTQAIFPQLAPPPYGEIETERLCQQKPVYLVFEKTKKVSAVGKVFGHRVIQPDRAWPLAQKEYLNLRTLREGFGMNSGPCQVVAPLGTKKELGALLVTEKATGKTLDYHIAKAIYRQQSHRLFDKLGCLANFFAKLHGNSQTDRPVSLDSARKYLDKLLDALSTGIPGSFERSMFQEYAANLWGNGAFTNDTEVIVHGDATPTNFIFQDQQVTGIDLERMQWANRCWDLGFVAAELKHHFMWRTGSGHAAEPFIGHFLWAYATSCRDAAFFHQITRRLPVYMALGLLRIARNEWLGEPHRKSLLSEALQCLRYGA